ncbi:hypothetical protein [Streptomyces phaeochromogenes]|uniref:hypothetical protein n=1 Tax=Streptomyces phaeochromogenes TaxID=1923 RepID=UPI00368AF5E4
MTWRRIGTHNVGHGRGLRHQPGPLVGGLVGAAGYKPLVGRHLPDVARQEPGQVPAARGEG